MCSRMLCITSDIIASSSSSANKLRARYYNQQIRNLKYMHHIPLPGMSSQILFFSSEILASSSSAINMFSSSSLAYCCSLILSIFLQRITASAFFSILFCAHSMIWRWQYASTHGMFFRTSFHIPFSRIP